MAAAAMAIFFFIFFFFCVQFSFYKKHESFKRICSAQLKFEKIHERRTKERIKRILKYIYS
ncbi:hypothetical protein BLOT_010460 [Blomia tropicalis]|nr:hypothetical protein BLOT_010460 [Blomia tropicalis]